MSVVETKIENKIFHIKLNRPDKKNAFDPDMINLITSAFLEVNKLSDISAVYLHGAGDCFCAGADLSWMKSMVEFSLDENIKDSEKLFDMFNAGLTCEVPVIGYFHGYVMGGATGLAAICDIGIVHEDTKFCFSEVKLGLAPAVISPFVLSKMNYNKANEYMLTAKLFGSKEALFSGLVEYSGNKEECDEYVSKVLSRTNKNGPQAVRETKKLIRKIDEENFEKFKSITTKVISARRVSAEGQEGLASFFEKRKPSWLEEVN